MNIYQIQFWYSVHFFDVRWFAYKFCLKSVRRSEKLQKK